jgi:hypothetical protein
LMAPDGLGCVSAYRYVYQVSADWRMGAVAVVHWSWIERPVWAGTGRSANEPWPIEAHNSFSPPAPKVRPLRSLNGNVADDDRESVLNARSLSRFERSFQSITCDIEPKRSPVSRDRHAAEQASFPAVASGSASVRRIAGAVERHLWIG